MASVPDAQAIGGHQGHSFTNWANTYTCEPELYFEPTTRQELSEILECARQKSKRVKVVGYGCSPSDLACTTDYMISVRHLNQILEVDKENCHVKVEAGALIQDLNEQLAELGMAISVLGSISSLSVAGTISTGTHGTGGTFGILSSYVLVLELMTANGEILEISSEKNAELFSAACLSLGCFGIILSVTLQCEPAFHLQQQQFSCTLDEILTNLDDKIDASDHFRFIWFPHTEGVVAWNTSRTQKPVCGKSSWFWQYAVGYYFLEFCFWISTLFPRLVPMINLFFYKLLYVQPNEQVGRSDHMFNFECLFKQHVMEWAIPRDKTWWVLKKLKSWLETSGCAAHFPVEVRFVKGDMIILSPAYGRDSCYINLVMYRPYGSPIRKDEYWDAFESIVTQVGGRPHWAKDHKVTGDQFAKLYPEWEQFCRIRKQLDPNGLFLNANLERVFGKKWLQ